MSWWAIVLIVLGLLVLVGIASMFIKKCTEKRNAKKQAEISQYMVETKQTKGTSASKYEDQ